MLPLLKCWRSIYGRPPRGASYPIPMCCRVSLSNGKKGMDLMQGLVHIVRVGIGGVERHTTNGSWGISTYFSSMSRLRLRSSLAPSRSYDWSMRQESVSCCWSMRHRNNSCKRSAQLGRRNMRPGCRNRMNTMMNVPTSIMSSRSVRSLNTWWWDSVTCS